MLPSFSGLFCKEALLFGKIKHNLVWKENASLLKVKKKNKRVKMLSLVRVLINNYQHYVTVRYNLQENRFNLKECLAGRN